MNSPHDHLKYHVTGAIERGEKEPVAGIPAQSTVSALPEQLEAFVDKHGFFEVLAALSTVCGDKAAHIATNWQDTKTAKVWDRASAGCATLANKFQNI